MKSFSVKPSFGVVLAIEKYKLLQVRHIVINKHLEAAIFIFTFYFTYAPRFPTVISSVDRINKIDKTIIFFRQHSDFINLKYRFYQKQSTCQKQDTDFDTKMTNKNVFDLFV